MITVTSAVKQMLEDEVRPLDAHPAEKELRTIDPVPQNVSVLNERSLAKSKLL